MSRNDGTGTLANKASYTTSNLPNYTSNNNHIINSHNNHYIFEVSTENPHYLSLEASSNSSSESESESSSSRESLYITDQFTHTTNFIENDYYHNNSEQDDSHQHNLIKKIDELKSPEISISPDTQINNNDDQSQLTPTSSSESDQQIPSQFHDSLALPHSSGNGFTSLYPITSPPDNDDNKHLYPATFFLSPITSHDSTYTQVSYDDILIDEKPPQLEQVPSSPASSIIIADQHQRPVEDKLTESEIDDQQLQETNVSPLLSLPLEILYRIVEIAYYDNHNYNSINSNLENFSNTVPLLSKKFHQLSLCFLYKYAIFNRPHSFDKFLTNLKKNNQIGTFVEFMDFQQFTSIGLGRTGRMNQEIQMVTSKTISKALSLTPNLLEFLASENIQDDLDVNVLNYLFNCLNKIKALDFCGASSESFARAFEELVIEDGNKSEGESEDYSMAEEDKMIIDDNSTIRSIYTKPNKNLSNLTKLSFHDCSNLSNNVFEKILPHLINLERLDLNHTSITSTSLLQYLPTSARLTHLSLARCSKLTTKDLINFLTHHPSVSQNSLKWLNIQVDSNVVTPLSDVYLLFTLKHLQAPDLRYLNLGGLPINNRILLTIKSRFTQLESLSLSHSNIDLNDLHDFFKGEHNNIKFLDLTGVKSLNKWNLMTILQKNFNSQLEAIEFDYKILYELAGNGEHVKVSPIQTSFIEEAKQPQVWKFYDNEGRRSWIYKLNEKDPEFKSIIRGKGSRKRSVPNMSNLVYYDLETGNKITTMIKKPDFLKYASRKVNCSIGYFNLNKYRSKTYEEEVWPVEFSQRGIYNYYSLNIK
ncbi:uncharacterized protein RJT21DRAFT_119138 [Scheffersomyces amazonensis]|uniref:uncharacterized protein n=1 Tax=Scheffersomyces amazonensis TaxID=1078765 RepID=UPI00315CCDE5